MIFVNELGNTVEFTTSRTLGQVTLSCRGPISGTDWILTLTEARVIRDLLNAMDLS